MLFPNRAPDPQLRPGMGYQGGSHALLGYEPGADALGYLAARMGYHGGSHALGAVSAAELQIAYDAGLDGDTLDALSAIGATDADIQALIAGTTDVASIQAKYSGHPTTEGTTVTQIGVSTPAPTSTAQVPSGSTILYTATVVGGAGDLTVTPASAMSQFASALTAHGMSVVQSSNDETILNKVFGTGAAIHFQFTILDSVGNAFTSDAKSVCDGVLMAIVGNNISSSNLSVVSSPAGGAAANPSSSSGDALAFLENNALFIGLGIGALIFLNNFTGGKRR